MAKFKDVPSQINFPSLEENIIDFWKKENIFQKSVDQRPEKDLYTFYDGPPFITGTPHHGHLLPSIAKDVIPRFWTMKGKKVRRVWGWDCHGLPVENKVEEQLGLKSKKDIEDLGINNYINACYSYVQNVSKEWEWYIDHIGRWVDFQNAYKTMDLPYMESVMWAFSQLYEKKLIYKGRRTSLFCPRCSTPLSNFEIAMDNSYRDVQDPAISIKFKLTDQDTYLLAWTTTPWTLPGNLALAVDKNQDYVKVKSGSQYYILAKNRLEQIFEQQEYQIQETFKGEQLISQSYQPLYNYFETSPNDYKIYHADFVTMEEGTGIVHIAPGFGQDDSEFGKQYGLSIIDHVDDEGKIISKVEPFAGLFVKKADPVVIDDLKSRQLLFRQDTITHSYPFCYRCGTPLIYKSQTAWYLDIESVRPQMLASNEKINWVPDHIKHGRFEQGLKTAPDWCLSRSRYWASPVPVWECECGEVFIPKSIQELEERSNQKVTNLHRPDIDAVTIQCSKCQREVKRVPEVLDCWFESGSMPYAQLHYPFENQQRFQDGFPADYIIEYIAQTRGWFYTLHVLSNSLFSSQAFDNCIVTGTIMGNDGRKMSKLFKNFPDPRMVLQKYGGEALRLYLMGSVVMLGENINIDEKDIQDRTKNVLLPLWNVYKYLSTYAQLHDWQPQKKPQEVSDLLDLWILNRTNQLTDQFHDSLIKYNLPDATRLIQPYIEDLSRWYIRQSRDRFVQGDDRALQTLWQVLVQFIKTTAPLIPFITEYLWQELVVPFDASAAQSVHLQDYPTIEKYDQKILSSMEIVRQVCELGNMIRKIENLSTRQPLQKATIKGPQLDQLTKEYQDIIKQELNVKEISTQKNTKLEVELDTKLNPKLIAEGDMRDLIRQIQSLRKEANLSLTDKIKVFAPDWPKSLEEEIKQKTLAISIEKDDQLHITKLD